MPTFQIIPDAGHHINADQPVIFNEVVKNICNNYDTYPRSFQVEVEEKTVLSNAANVTSDIEDVTQNDFNNLQISNKNS